MFQMGFKEWMKLLADWIRETIRVFGKGAGLVEFLGTLFREERLKIW